MRNERASIETIVRGVACVDGLVLLCRSRGAANTYLPGGHIDFGESARVALKREIREELGLDCTVGRFLGGAEHTFVQKGRTHCEINLVFALEAAGLRGGAPVASREAQISFAWARAGELAAASLEPHPLCALIPHWLTAGADGTFASTYPTERPQ